MAVYSFRPELVHAEQWDPSRGHYKVCASPQDLLLAGADPVLHLDIFQSIREAKGELGAIYTVSSSNHVVWKYVHRGDWVVVDSKDNTSIFNDQEFHKKFKLEEGLYL